MREIKFRVWDIKQERFIDFNKFGFDDGLWYIQEIDENERGIDPPLFYEEGKAVVMQYIGLKDMNGVEIYEGDIVRAEEMPNDMFEVWFRSGLYHIGNWNTHGFSNAFSFFEVIGNRYENPELLKEEPTC